MVKSSTQRVREHRKRKKIAEIDKKSRSLTFFLRMYYQDHEDLSFTTWIPAQDLYKASVTDRQIDVSVLFPNEDLFIKGLNEAGIERQVVKINQKDVVIIRPKFLKGELNS